MNSMGEKNRELRMELFDSDDPRERDRWKSWMGAVI